jgi:hypothetical protein
MCCDRDVGQQDTACEAGAVQSPDRAAHNVDEIRDPGGVDRCACLSNGRRVDVDRKDMSVVPARPRLRKKAGSAADIDGVRCREAINRGQAHGGRHVSCRAEAVSGDLHQLA